MTADVVSPLVRHNEGLRREGRRRLEGESAMPHVMIPEQNSTYSCGAVCFEGSDGDS